MADFEDNNPFSGSDRKLSTSSGGGTQNDFGRMTEPFPPVGGEVADFDSTNVKDEFVDVTSITTPPRQSAVQNESRTYNSRIEQILYENPDVEITISEAGKSHEGNSRGFIAYTIKIMDLTVRRRYSEFESLRTNLSKLFPTLIIPPIPEKHSMSDYAAAPTKAKEDATIIEHRRRMLSVFLNRCRSMKEIRENSVYQRFLDPNASWSEVLNSPPVSNLPKSILKAPPLDPASASSAHSYLPVPSSSAKLKSEEDTAFHEAEQNAKEYESVIVGGVEKVNRRIIKRYTDQATDYSELGARFNAFSLEENGLLATAIEKVGQAIDNSYMTTEVLVSALSSSFSEPLGESAQFASIVRSVLKYRRQKALQQEITSDSLATKRSSLEILERSEQESQRINAYLHRDLGESGEGGEPPATAPTDSALFPPTHDPLPASTGSSPTKAKKSGFKFPGIGKLNHAIQGIIDVDPEATRRNNIGKTREQISQLEEALTAAKGDVEVASDSVRKDLERFQKTKEDDLRKMMISYLRCHIEWARKNLDSWNEAQAHINKISI